MAKWATWLAGISGRSGGLGIGSGLLSGSEKPRERSSRYAFSGVRVIPILPADVEIPPTARGASRGAAGAGGVGRLGGGVHLARPGERGVGAAPLPLAGDADGAHGGGALGGPLPPGGLGAGGGASRRRGAGRGGDAGALSPSQGPAGPRRQSAGRLPGGRDLPPAARAPAPGDAPAHPRPAGGGGAAPARRAARRDHRPSGGAADAARSADA